MFSDIMESYIKVSHLVCCGHKMFLYKDKVRDSISKN